MTGKEEQNELAVPAIKASPCLLLMGSHAHSSQQYFSLMSQVCLGGSCKLPTPSHSHYRSLLQATFFLSCTAARLLPSAPLTSVCRARELPFDWHLTGMIMRFRHHTEAFCDADP